MKSCYGVVLLQVFIYIASDFDSVSVLNANSHKVYVQDAPFLMPSFDWKKCQSARFSSKVRDKLKCLQFVKTHIKTIKNFSHHLCFSSTGCNRAQSTYYTLS